MPSEVGCRGKARPLPNRHPYRGEAPTSHRPKKWRARLRRAARCAIWRARLRRAAGGLARRKICKAGRPLDAPARRSLALQQRLLFRAPGAENCFRLHFPSPRATLSTCVQFSFPCFRSPYGFSCSPWWRSPPIRLGGRVKALLRKFFPRIPNRSFFPLIFGIFKSNE